MLIYTSHNSSRFLYACEIVFENYDGVVNFTSKSEKFEAYQGPKLEYSRRQEFSDSFFIQCTEVLWNNKIELHDISLGKWKELPIFYTTDGSLPFDIFSATFFLATRYEEYLPFKGDRFYRFPATESLAYKQGFLHRPIIDFWRKQFEDELILKWPQINFMKRAFSFISTIDVDSAFAYKHKGFKRTAGGIIKDLAKFDFSNLSQRISTLRGKKQDVYETYDYIASQCEAYRVKNHYFFLLSDFGAYDKNVPHRSRGLQGLIKRLIIKNGIGIHPGFASNLAIETLKTEVERLENIIGGHCNTSRQHYLMLQFPKTYRSYIEVGIHEDYTMGFADSIGFRAGTSQPFKWFDLEKNEKTDLQIFPFAVMDTTLKNYMRLSPQEAVKLTCEMMKDVASTGGNFIALWHNETLSEAHGWQGWRMVWESLLQEQSKISNI